jgi:hypothetical protein
MDENLLKKGRKTDCVMHFKNPFRNLVDKCEGKRALGIPRSRWQDNVIWP